MMAVGVRGTSGENRKQTSDWVCFEKLHHRKHVTEICHLQPQSLISVWFEKLPWMCQIFLYYFLYIFNMYRSASHREPVELPLVYQVACRERPRPPPPPPDPEHFCRSPFASTAPEYRFQQRVAVFDSTWELRCPPPEVGSTPRLGPIPTPMRETLKQAARAETT